VFYLSKVLVFERLPLLEVFLVFKIWPQYCLRCVISDSQQKKVGRSPFIFLLQQLLGLVPRFDKLKQVVGLLVAGHS